MHALILLHAVEGSVVGVIGNVTSEPISFPPIDQRNIDVLRFFINTAASANASGTISSLRYCYTIQTGDDDSETYQATVGFYRQDGDDFTLSNNVSFDITIDSTPQVTPDTTFQCEDKMIIPSVEVQEGEMIGVCTRNFDDSSVKRINFLASVQTNDRDLLRNDPRYDDNFCVKVGSVPTFFSRGHLDPGGNRLLLLYGHISKYHNGHPQDPQ